MKDKGQKDEIWFNDDIKDLVETILSLTNMNEAKSFLRDLLSEKELVEFGKRWKAAQMLHDGISYTEIVSHTGLSSTTVARISKWLHSGSGGYIAMLKRRPNV